MKRGREFVAGVTALAVLGGCGVAEDGNAQSRQSACDQLGVPVNPEIHAPYGITDDIGDYVIRMSVTTVGDNSITGNIIEFVEVENEEVCRRFLDPGTDEPLQIHSNYNTDSWTNSRKQVAMVVDHGVATNFTEAQSRLAELVERQPGVVLTIIGDRRNSYDGDDDYVKRDVAYQIDLPLR